MKPGRAFLKYSVDYVSLLLLKSGIRKNTSVVKAYNCLFIYFSTRTVHSELVGDLSSEVCLCALNFFFVHYSKSSIIYSDNATNFLGANRQLPEMYDLLQNDEHRKEMD